MSGTGEANSAQIAEIRARAEAKLELAEWARDSLSPSDMDGISAQNFASDLLLVARDALALVEVVEAWDDFAGEWGHSSNCFHRASARGWTPGDPPMLDCVCGLARLEEALSKVSK